ncbi:MAG: YihY family inner membrane protein, partial [Planctomycetota bacterium]|nr:YihY family inner membrane protein [Planctomycetota bacterium]
MRRSSLSDAARRIKTFLSHDIWERDLADLGRMKALFFHQLRVVFLVMRGFAKDRCGLRAAGLTYITLLSFIPFLAVAFTLFDKVGGLDRLAEDHLKPFVYRVLTADPDVIPPASTVNGEETPGEDGLDLPDEGGEEAAPRDLAAEGRRAEIIRYIDQFVSNIETGGLGWAAGAFMLITAVGLLSSTEKSLNDIWGVKRQRSWFRRFTVYWAGITIGPVLLGISIALTAALQSNVAVKWVQGYVPFFKEALSILIPLLFAWGAFTLLYLYMPNTTVRLISALVGGIIAGTLWQTSIWGYSLY